jgi:hypothetical protein
LREALGGRYRTCGSLGNSNYENQGGEVILKDWTAGSQQVIDQLKRKNVILLCACWQYTACHRKVIAEQFAAEFELEPEEIWKERKPKPARDEAHGFLFDMEVEK